MLLVIQLLSMNGCFPLCYEFFPVCHGLRPLEMGRMSDYDISAEAEGLGRLTERVPNDRPNVVR